MPFYDRLNKGNIFKEPRNRAVRFNPHLRRIWGQSHGRFKRIQRFRGQRLQNRRIRRLR